MDELSITRDDWSIKITSPLSRRFYLRLLWPQEHHRSLVFTDFLMDAEDTKRGAKALTMIANTINVPLPGMRLEFLDIYPSYAASGDRSELIRRFDQIVAAVRDFAARQEMNVSNPHLDPGLGKVRAEMSLE